MNEREVFSNPAIYDFFFTYSILRIYKTTEKNLKTSHTHLHYFLMMSTYSSRHLAYNSLKDFGGVRRNLITLNKQKRYNFYNATGMIQMKRDNNM